LPRYAVRLAAIVAVRIHSARPRARQRERSAEVVSA
jgi:hypothetical protein